MINRIFNTGIRTRTNAKIELNNGTALAHQPVAHFYAHDATLTYEERGKLICLHGQSLQLPTLTADNDQMIVTLKNTAPNTILIYPTENNTIEHAPAFPLRAAEWCQLIADYRQYNWIILI